MDRPFLYLLFVLAVSICSAGVAKAQTCTYSPRSADFTWTGVETGIEYASYSMERHKKVEPVYVHVLKIRLGEADLTLRSLRPLGRSQSVERVARYFREGGVDVRAAINGDYFAFVGEEKDPLGLHVSGGQVLWFPHNTSSLVVDDENRAHIKVFTLTQTITGKGVNVAVTGANRKAERDEAVLYSGYYREKTILQEGCTAALLKRDRLRPMFNESIDLTVEQLQTTRRSTRMAPLDLVLVACGEKREGVKELKPGDKLTLSTTADDFPPTILEAISGGPRVLRDGAVVDEASKESFSMPLRFYIPKTHPRTAVGVSSDGETAYLLVAEGRIKRSAGLTAIDAGCILKGAGAADAMLFDGGGSAVMMVQDSFYNIPHKGRNYTPRTLANILAVVRLGARKE